MKLTHMARITLIILGLSIALGQSGEAQTRLGLHVTQEELNIWRQRRTDNVNSIGGQSFQTIYQKRILGPANDFRSQSHPGGDGHWDGYTGGGCVPGGQQVTPGRGNGNGMMKSAFVFLLSGDTNYANPVRSELLNQIAQSGTNFSNRNKWCPYNNGVGVFSADSMEITPWVMRFVLAYNYLIAGGYTGFSTSERTSIETWLHNAALLWDQVMVETVQRNTMTGAFNTPPDYTCTGGCSGTSGITAFNAYTVDNPAGVWENQLGTGAVLSAAVGVLVNDATLKTHAHLFVEQKLMFSVYPNGASVDQHRWDQCAPPCGPGNAWGHVMGDIENPIVVADYMARNGDTSLYTYSTSSGRGSSVGGPKTLGTVQLHYARMVNGTIEEYGTTDGGQLNSTYRLTWNSPGNQPNYGHLATMVSNIYYQNSEVHTANQVPQDDGNCANSGNGCFGMLNGIYPDLPFMFGNMEGKVQPYPRQGGPGVLAEPTDLRILPNP